MGTVTKIQWATHTFNPWRGCTKIDHACANCYADAQSKRNPSVLGVWGPNGTRVVASESKWREPIKWDREAEKAGERRRVFCASLADVFEDWQQEMRDTNGLIIIHECTRGHIASFDSVYANGIHCHSCESVLRPISMDDVRARLFRLIDSTPNLDWLLLTKRPENIRRMWPCTKRENCPAHIDKCGFRYRDNVWLITSAGTQETADRAIPELLKCRDLAPVLGVSCEPLLEEVDLSRWIPFGVANWQCQKCESFQRDEVNCLHCGADVAYLSGSHAANRRDEKNKFTGRRNSQAIDWIIVGGESGRNARPCDVAWIRSIVRQCKSAGVPCFVKQLGAGSMGFSIRELPRGMVSFVDSKGGDPDEWTEDLRVREFPR